MLSIDYSRCTHTELINIIRECQEQLSDRGTVTICQNVCYDENNPAYTLYITDKPIIYRV